MVIKQHHIEFCRQYALTGLAKDSYMHVFKSKKDRSASASASALLKRPEMQQLIQEFRDNRQQELEKSRTAEIKELEKQVLSNIELDYFHSQVVRGQITFPDIVQVREYRSILDKAGNVVGGEWKTELRSVNRAPNIKERQRSAAELYKRFGSYKQPGKTTDFEDTPDANNTEAPEVVRYIVLSTGERKQIPN